MLKVPVSTQLEEAPRCTESLVNPRSMRTSFRARLLGRQCFLTQCLKRCCPFVSRPVCFPSGAMINAGVLTAAEARSRPALITEGRLRLGTPWRPAAVRAVPLGLFVPALRMRMPAPGESRLAEI